MWVGVTRWRRLVGRRSFVSAIPFSSLFPPSPPRAAYGFLALSLSPYAIFVLHISFSFSSRAIFWSSRRLLHFFLTLLTTPCGTVVSLLRVSLPSLLASGLNRCSLIMQFLSSAALAVCLLSPAGLSAAISPRFLLHPSEIEIAVLGGSAIRLPQVYNENFSQLGRGPRSVGKAYQKFGVAFPDDLTSLLEEILAELRRGSGSKTNTTTNANQGAWGKGLCW
jgi:hypothetical protein